MRIKEYFSRNKEKSILAGLSFLLSLIVYLLTIAPTVSFWDCGEFIATSYTLGVPHPPGSPLYLLIGRFFSMLPIGSDIAYRVNLISPIVSALAVMFLFLIVVQLLRAWGEPRSKLQKVAVYGGAFIGALTFAFTDSHWFNAVEAEVYAFSTFLTAIVVWLILAWEKHAGQKGHERYLLTIAYIIGLALGIHLLNVLAIFFIALIVYFKHTKISSLGWLVADLIIGVAISALLFLLFLQLKISFNLQALFTVTVFMAIYLYIYRKTPSPRLKEHSQNVLMAFFASLVFLVINGGVIRGLPRIADRLGLVAVAVLILAVFGGTIWAIRKKHNLISLALISLVLIIVGYSSYSTIFIRSAQDPGIDENDPETTHQAVAYLEREQYGRREFTDIFNRAVWKPEVAYKYKNTLDYFWNYQIKEMYIRYFNWQFIGRLRDQVDPFQFLLPFPFLIGIYGMMSHFQKDKHKALAVLALFLFTGLMIILYLNQDDPQPRERDYSYVGSFFAFAIWIGVGVSTIIGQLTEIKHEKTRQVLAYLVSVAMLIILPVSVLAANYHEHKRTGNFVASDYAYNLLQTCEPDAILFTNGDNDTFPLWYLQEVEHVRRDIRIVNLALLNAGWYISQLRDAEPKVAIGLSDDQIDRMGAMPWQKRTVRVSQPPGSALPALEWELKPTFMDGRGIRTQDIMIWHILENNRWQKPVYFAVSVPRGNLIGLDDFMQMEGLALRVHPQKVERANPAKIENNLMNVYNYRNLDNPKVFFDDRVVALLGNYREAFFQLAVGKLYEKDYRGVIATLDSMEAKMPEDVIPITNKSAYLRFGVLYNEALQAGGLQEVSRADELQSRLEVLVRQSAASPKELVEYAKVYMSELQDYDSAQKILEQLLISHPADSEIVGLLVRIYEIKEDYNRAVDLVSQWLNYHPQDDGAIQLLDQYRAKSARKSPAVQGNP